MMRAQVQSNVDHLTEFQQLLLDRQLVLNGVFNEEIARIKSVQVEAETKLGMVDTVEKADQYRRDADAYSKKLRDQADNNLQAAQNALGQANKKMEDALSKEASVASRESVALSLKTEYEAKAKTFEQSCSVREAAIATADASLRAREEKLASGLASLAAQKADQLKKLEAARALAAS